MVTSKGSELLKSCMSSAFGVAPIGIILGLVVTPAFLYFWYGILPFDVDSFGWALAFVFVSHAIISYAICFLMCYHGASNHAKVHTAFEEKVKTVLERYDYYDAGLAGAIALDVKNKQLAVIDAKDHGKLSKATITTIDIDDIENISTVRPGYETVSYSQAAGSGFDGATTAAVENIGNAGNAIFANVAALRGAQLATGLTIEKNDLHSSEVFCGLPYKEALRWMKLIGKLRQGELEVQEEPVLFPKDQMAVEYYIKAD